MTDRIKARLAFAWHTAEVFIVIALILAYHGNAQVVYALLAAILTWAVIGLGWSVRHLK